MVRVTSGPATRAKHQKIRQATKGYRGKNHTVFRIANQAFIKAGQHAYRGRKQKKRDFRQLWITRINIALRNRGEKYSTMMHRWMHARVDLDRKTLSELAINYPAIFDKLVTLGQSTTPLQA
ncbi:50S ribosomal protein L20 [Candidatus Peribacteria bacterium]|nr:50S ribosomal protein L20 [Candidatus Peribacteria bacterium]